MGVATAAAVVAAGATAASAAYSMSGAGSPSTSTMSASEAASVSRRSIERGTRQEAKLLPFRLTSELAARRDFDPAFLSHKLEMDRASAMGGAENALAVQEEYAPRFAAANLDLLKQVDPNAVATRDQMGRMVSDDLANGRELSTAQRHAVLDSARGGQIARGNYRGNAAAFDEAMKLSGAGEAAYQQRLGNASAFLAGPRLQDMWQGLPAAYAPMDLQREGAAFRVFNPNAGNQAAQAGVAQQNANTNAFAAQSAAPNPWMQGLGQIAGAAGSIGALYSK